MIGAAIFHQQPCLDLGQTQLTEWNGLLFDAAATSPPTWRAWAWPNT